MEAENLSSFHGNFYIKSCFTFLNFCCFIRTLLAKYCIMVKSELGWLVVSCNGKVSHYQVWHLL